MMGLNWCNNGKYVIYIWLVMHRCDGKDVKFPIIN
jgi:hypothetical protein